MHMNYLTSLLCTLFLIGCGGGGGSSAEVIVPIESPPPATTPPPPPPATPTFDIEYNSAPDATIYDAVSKLEIPTCTLSRIQHTMIVDLNNDNHKDILMFVLCGHLDHPNQGINVVHDDPTPNTMLALISDGRGSYEVNNIDTFGSDHVQLGGEKGGVAGFFTMLEDTTSGIGLPHITYMVSRDDHQRKRSEDWTNHFSQQGVFTADYNNTYNLVDIGEPLWAQGVAALPNMNYEWDLLFGYWDNDYTTENMPLAYRNSGQDWFDVSDEYNNDTDKHKMSQHAYLLTFDINDHRTFGEVKSVTSTHAIGSVGHGFSIYDITQGQVTETLVYDTCDELGCIEWGDPEADKWCGRKEIVEIDGVHYFGGLAWDHFELWWPTPDSDPLLLAFAAMNRLPDGEQYDANKEYDCNTQFEGGTVRVLFELQGNSLVMLDNPFPENYINGGGVHKQTIDLNGDGYMDYWSSGGSAQDGEPQIYINDKEGNLVYHQRGQLPTLPQQDFCNEDGCIVATEESFLGDLNSDGIVDLIQYHAGSYIPNLPEHVQGGDLSVFENKSGQISIWYGE